MQIMSNYSLTAFGFKRFGKISMNALRSRVYDSEVFMAGSCLCPSTCCPHHYQVLSRQAFLRRGAFIKGPNLPRSLYPFSTTYYFRKCNTPIVKAESPQSMWNEVCLPCHLMNTIPQLLGRLLPQ